MCSVERRRATRRVDDGCYLTKEQVEDLQKKVDANHDATIRSEDILRRLVRVEKQVGNLCSRITLALWSMVGTAILAVGSLIAAIWHIVKWIQELIEHSMIIT